MTCSLRRGASGRRFNEAAPRRARIRLVALVARVRPVPAASMEAAPRRARKPAVIQSGLSSWSFCGFNEAAPRRARKALR